ncbi:MAG TPA: adenylate/guanylate cyclase domain-containing protein [Coleofasciculaceae cyanobacterium]|jgi:adenylate cyclase
MGKRHLTTRETFKWITNRLVPTLLALLAVVGLWFVGQHMERAAYDLLTWISAKPAERSPVTLVLIDDESLTRLHSRFGSAPWPRKAFVDIFQRIQTYQPAVMVFDGHFVNINEPGDTEVFAALHQFPHLVIGLVMNENQEVRSRLNTALPAYYQLSLGVVSVREEADGKIRSLKPIYHIPGANRLQSGVFPALSLAGAYEYLATKSPGQGWILDVDEATQPPRLLLYPENKVGGGLSAPLSAGDAFYLHWYRPQNVQPGEYQASHEAIPLWRLFEPSGQPPDLKGRIVLIGSSATLYRDYHHTPMARQHLGPDIHATAIDNILHGETIRKASLSANMLILLLLSLAMGVMRLKIRSFGQTLLYLLGAMVIYAWLVFWMLSERFFWLDLVTPLLFMLVAFLAGSTLRIIFKEQKLAAMERNLSQLVDPEVFREIQRMSHVLKPGGHKLEITSMFVDIRNFTHIAEHLQPAEVTALLNEFYEDMVTVVFKHHGTIDKFMGDGILIIFGAPLPNPEHRQSAVLAAHEILSATKALSLRWQETRGIDTDIGISLNSGPAFVGFLGPTDKLEYTGVGDTVNICVRLQEQTKQFQTRLIMSEDTVQGARQPLSSIIPSDSYQELGEVAVRGREATIRIYTLQHAFLDAEAEENKSG